ncbi:MAG TPA: hypothetical protein VNK05_17200, partial [Chloroflexota bacterium]|nr:hypothetical protein [Chloroflexota bacterium]
MATRLRRWWARLVAVLLRPHRDVKSFATEVETAGVTGRVDAGVHTVPATKIVGSVGRSQNLRSDFFYKSGKVTARFHRIGQAMQAGRLLPPVELYKARLRRRRGERDAVVTEYYVVDGHHRVAMAKKLGQDFLDAHVVEYRLNQAGPPAPEAPEAPEAPKAPKATAHASLSTGPGVRRGARWGWWVVAVIAIGAIGWY